MMGINIGFVLLVIIVAGGLLLLVGLMLLGSGNRKAGKITLATTGLLLLLPLLLIFVSRSNIISRSNIAVSSVTTGTLSWSFMPAMIFVLALVVILIVWLVRAGKFAWIGWGIGAAVLIFISLFYMTYGRATDRLNEQRVLIDTWGPVNPIEVVELDGSVIVNATEKVYAVVAPTPLLATPSLSPVWSAGMEVEFEADIYPSMESAAKALGRSIASLLPTLTEDNQSVSTVQIYGNVKSGEFEASVLYALRDGLQEEMPDINCLVETISPKDKITSSDPQAVSVFLERIVRNVHNIDLEHSNGQ